MFEKLTSAHKRHLKALLNNGAPVVLLQLVALVLLCGLAEDHIQFAELFAGEAALTSAFAARGFISIGYELKRDPICENILGRAGFAHAVALVLQLEPSGAIWFCNTA